MSDEPTDQTLETDGEESTIETTGEEAVVEADEGGTRNRGRVNDSEGPRCGGRCGAPPPPGGLLGHRWRAG